MSHLVKDWRWWGLVFFGLLGFASSAVCHRAKNTVVICICVAVTVMCLVGIWFCLHRMLNGKQGDINEKKKTRD